MPFVLIFTAYPTFEVPKITMRSIFSCDRPFEHVICIDCSAHPRHLTKMYEDRYAIYITFYDSSYIRSAENTDMTDIFVNARKVIIKFCL